MSYNKSRAIYVLINGVRVANLRYLHSTFEREFLVENGALSVPSTVMYVTLRREICPFDGRGDSLELRTLSNFILKICAGGRVSTYTGCQWLGFSETIDENGVIVEEMKVASLSYSISVS